MPVTISDSLAGRRALVTGGSKGTGAAIAGRLTEAGATVMTVARTMPGGYPDPGLFVAADISTPGGVQQVIDRVAERFGVLDILVHTVGPVLLPRFCGGMGVGSGTGSRPDLRIGRRRWVVLITICRPGPSLKAPTGVAGLICLAWARGRGPQVRAASGCVPSLNLRKG
jgi:short chain dehydrogenase